MDNKRIYNTICEALNTAHTDQTHNNILKVWELMNKYPAIFRDVCLDFGYRFLWVSSYTDNGNLGGGSYLVKINPDIEDAMKEEQQTYYRLKCLVENTEYCNIADWGDYCLDDDIPTPYDNY